MAHPDFARAAGSDPGTIRFDHALHTGGAPGEKGVRLACGDCHRSERQDALPGAPSQGVVFAADGAHRRGPYQAPVRFARDCERCHQIATVIDGVGEVHVPHVAPEAVRSFLVRVAVQAKQSDADAAARSAERGLYATGVGCAKCHRVAEGVGQGALPVVRPHIPERWYPRARFDHGRHTAIAFRGGGTGADAECAFCHSSVLVSRRAEDIAIPGISTCRQCHGADREVPGGCVTCHTFHLPPSAGASDYEALDHDRVQRGMTETRYGLRTAMAQWPRGAFFALPKLVWGRPDLQPGTRAFDDEVFRRYGLFPADFDNDGLPLGLIQVKESYKGREPGITVTCELCHSSSLFGNIVAGQPNRFSDFEKIWVDLSVVSGERPADPLYFKTPHGNTVVNGADQLGLLGLVVRNPDLSYDVPTVLRIMHDAAGDLKSEFDAIAYLKTPPWYTYKTKQAGAAGYYFDGGYPKDGNFSAFTYLVAFRSSSELRAPLAAWQRTGHDYLASLEAPRYPFPIDRSRLPRGRRLYDGLCAKCHGGYEGEEATMATLRYPGLVVPAEEVGTDAVRAQFPASFGRRMRAILHKQYTLTKGYVAQPLTAIWAQAPYLHNGSVPTLAQLLEPSRRVARYALVANPNEPRDFDPIEVGWRTEPLPPGPVPEGVRAFDPLVTPGLGNQGHTYGAELTSEERADLIEFLKTL
jgi:mono/diheme cytochrome c family protein